MDGKQADGHHTASSRQVGRRRSSFLEDIDLPSWELELASQAAATYALAEENSELGRVVKHSLAVMEEALDRYTGEKMSISFNGGKDCTVMLHLWAAASYRRYRGLPCKLHTLYILDPDTFEEIDLFVNECIKRYQLDLVAVEGNIKDALAKMLASYPTIEAVLVGARSTDPYYEKMVEFIPCDKGWPRVMRVHPILHWSYAQIWDFLLRLKVPFCSLYERGYTSIGNVHNTIANPALRNDQAPSGFDPAWLLQDEKLERAGRVKRDRRGSVPPN